ncbi:unnamed protein product [Urochloa decumbens]|uniref:F-box protein AT5G49610-like beta-propeller domain-containing protein n=1 Tax=Urochloa decumbens TaxID=240449 RepID=A0ABC8VCY6_9POAL
MLPAAAAVASASSVSLVFGSHDLLGEILLRLGFPTTLVRAALACKRWLRVASDPAFLRLFRARHPPRLLGFYASGCSRIGPAEFWPVRHPPELASAVARAASILDALPGRVTDIVDCRHGRLHVCFSRGGDYSSNGDGDGELEVVLSPLQYPAGGAVMLQLPPAPGSAEHSRCYRLVTHTAAFHYHSIQFLAENGGDGLQCFELEQTYYRNNRQTNLKVNVLQDSAWDTRISITTGLPGSKLITNVLLMVSKLYMATNDNVLLLDLESASFCIIELPEKSDFFHNCQLLKADDSRVYLVTVRREQLRFWQHRSVSGSVGNWLLVDTVYLDMIFSNLGTPVGFFKVTFVGDNAEFVLLQSGRRFYYIDIRCGTIEEVVQRDSFSGIWPLMMIWPPNFPKFKEGYDQNE